MTQNFFFVLHKWQDEKHLSLFLYWVQNLPPLILFINMMLCRTIAGCMSYELCNRPHSLWSLSGSVVEHWSAESEGLRFNSSWGLRILSLSHTWWDNKHLSLHISYQQIWCQSCTCRKQCSINYASGPEKPWNPLRSYATGIYSIVYWSYFTQYFRLWTFWSPYLKKRKKTI